MAVAVSPCTITRVGRTLSDRGLHVGFEVVEVEAAFPDRHHPRVGPVGDVDVAVRQHRLYRPAQQRGVVGEAGRRGEEVGRGGGAAAPGRGGGFVGGDKEQMLEFATYVTAQTGLAVLCLNYDLAPKAKYPSQLAQLNEAVQHIQSNSDLVEFIDTEQWFFGGDSAGAQIAGQYVLIQTNEKYRHHLGYSASLTPSQLKGFIAYCGPLAMNLLANRQSNHPAIKFFYNTVSRSVIGSRQWSQSPELSEASLANHVNAQFPSSFVTDGNKFTFDDHGKYFVKRLVELGVAVEHLFIETEELVHEYQFEYQTAAAQRCLAETIAFIKANRD